MELTGSHGKRPGTVKQLHKACQDMAAAGAAWGTPLAAATTALGSHTKPCTAPHGCRHLMGAATSAAGEMLVPRQGNEPRNSRNACGDQKTKQREQWVCSGHYQRRIGRAWKSSSQPCRVGNSQFPYSAPSCPERTQRQGVRTSAVDQRALESCHFLRHRRR